MKTGNLVCVYGLALVSAMSVACSSDSTRRTAGNEGNTRAAERTAGETGRAVDDSAVTTKVKAKMASESRLASLTDIGVSTNNGVVTLTGTVPSNDYKKDVEQIARSVDGVTDVKNDIKVDKNATAGNTRHERTSDRDRDRDTDRSRGAKADSTR